MTSVGLIIHQFGPHYGGAESWTYRFAQWLHRRGYEVHVLARRFDERSGSEPLVFHKLQGVRKRIEFAIAAAEKVKQLRLDVTHDTGHGWFADIFHPHSGSPGAVFERRLCAYPEPYRSAKRVMQRASPRYRQLMRVCDNQVACRDSLFVMVSQLVADDYAKWHRCSPARHRVIYNGVDVPHYRSAEVQDAGRRLRRHMGVGDRERLILFVGNNYQLKGLRPLLQAVSQLAMGRVPVKLSVVGRRATRRWRGLAQRLGIRDRVAFHTDVTDPAPYYCAADVFALPTAADSCSLTVLEALAAGVPVVTTRANGAAELMTPQSGIVLDSPRDVRALAEALAQLADTPRGQANGATHSEPMQQRLSLEANFQAVERVYEEVLQRKGLRSIRATA